MPDEVAPRPQAGVDYPRDLAEFHQFFLKHPPPEAVDLSPGL
jgi:hypothetical protein